jgi:transposase-like protein
MGLLKGMNAVTQLLGLDEFEVVDLQDDPVRRTRRIVLVPRVTAGLCPGCKKATRDRHQVRDRIVRDLPMGSYATELVVRQPQYQCPECRSCFTPGFKALAESAHATERFLERVSEMVRSSDVKNAAAFFGLPEKTLEEWYYGYLRRRASPPGSPGLEPIRSLGIDELSRKKSGEDTAAS